MKYNVTCECYSNSNDLDYGRFNYVGDYIEAEYPEQAIDIALECIADAIRNNNEGHCTDATINEDDKEIYVVNDNGNIEDYEVETYYDFEAEEVETSGKLREVE